MERGGIRGIPRRNNDGNISQFACAYEVFSRYVGLNVLYERSRHSVHVHFLKNIEVDCVFSDLQRRLYYHNAYVNLLPWDSHMLLEPFCQERHSSKSPGS